MIILPYLFRVLRRGKLLEEESLKIYCAYLKVIKLSLRIIQTYVKFSLYISNLILNFFESIISFFFSLFLSFKIYEMFAKCFIVDNLCICLFIMQIYYVKDNQNLINLI